MTELNTAKIIAVTKPLIKDLITGSDLSAEAFIAYCARVSNPLNQMNHQTSEKLLKYCLKHAHFSIFEMVNVVMEISTTRDIGRQILRHRSFSFQEFSQRYADPTESLGWALRDARLQDTKNRQNSFENEDEELADDWDVVQDHTMQTAIKNYKWAIENGIAKEQARAILPEGLMLTRMYMNGTLRSWIHYCNLRCARETQKEHQEVALSAWSQILEIFPSLIGVVNHQGNHNNNP